MNIELIVAEQEISTVMHDVNKNNQEVRDSFCQSELADAQKFAELDREGADIRVANNTSVQPNNSALSDVSQVQPGQSSNNAVSEPCTSNSCIVVMSQNQNAG